MPFTYNPGQMAGEPVKPEKIPKQVNEQLPVNITALLSQMGFVDLDTPVDPGNELNKEGE